jgi:hypothetical protein
LVAAAEAGNVTLPPQLEVTVTVPVVGAQALVIVPFKMKVPAEQADGTAVMELQLGAA